MLSVVVVSVFMLSDVILIFAMLSVVVSVFMLSIVMLSVFMLSDVVLIFAMLSVVVSVFMLSIVTLSVVMLSVFMLIVVAPQEMASRAIYENHKFEK